MIVYFLQRAMFTRRGKIWLRLFRGHVEFCEPSPMGKRGIKLGTGTVNRQQVIYKATVFDETTTPPTLIRCDYGFHELRTHGAELPLTYIYGDRILRSADDSDVFAQDISP